MHGNLPAFEAVLRDVETENVDEVWCLGDLVGYGAKPDECVSVAAERCDVCLIGNHDLAVIGKLSLDQFSKNARTAAEWTRERIGEEARAFLGGLDHHDEQHELGLYHASPRDPVWEYVLSEIAADGCMDAMGPRVGAVGHSHVALYFTRTGEDADSEGFPAPAGTRADLSEGDWLVNPGGVGQPRDGDPRAAWMLLELPAWEATWKRVSYPVDEAAAAIREAGLPPTLAERLYYGQ
ncbi:MAG: metallophosphoesterase family protein [Thermoleophilaceae bacterium]|nr:metallophosphoesterase family protein [Thermoleophilaceae bacterium]